MVVNLSTWLLYSTLICDFFEVLIQPKCLSYGRCGGGINAFVESWALAWPGLSFFLSLVMCLGKEILKPFGLLTNEDEAIVTESM